MGRPRLRWLKYIEKYLWEMETEVSGQRKKGRL